MTAPPAVSDPSTQAEDDDALALTASVREPERFAVLYDRYFEEIYRYLAFRLGQQAAEDLAAETFLVAFRKRQTFDPGRGAVRPWLYGIATNLVVGRRRKLARMLAAFRRVPSAKEAEVGMEDRVTTRVDAARARRPLGLALAGLSPGDRDVLLLIALAGLTYDEVAEALCIPYGTVSSRLNRARRKVRAALENADSMNGDADG
ncbi:RNA polymerase subunit sigma-70 [Spongiactinospora gelatinilytica]|uniref:RNA polymerase subunit sigma-70 n=1 Tax=Spongiactinospora gelatinilytica TaxID=2666298 RepID=A0A2W2GQ39_9ACTN|nr:RNA polymerase sigma factor [Spongiactinospora gelatinilytica]PZG36357.1 RNA polymerase subunit sigma-70 [Spongiactinospora gelatinilytica]